MDRDDAVNGEGGFLKRRLRIETDLLAIDGFSFVLGFQIRTDVGRFRFSAICMRRLCHCQIYSLPIIIVFLTS